MQRAVHVSWTTTALRSGKAGRSFSQIQRAMFSLVGLSRPAIYSHELS